MCVVKCSRQPLSYLGEYLLAEERPEPIYFLGQPQLINLGEGAKSFRLDGEPLYGKTTTLEDWQRIAERCNPQKRAEMFAYEYRVGFEKDIALYAALAPDGKGDQIARIVRACVVRAATRVFADGMPVRHGAQGQIKDTGDLMYTVALHDRNRDGTPSFDAHVLLFRWGIGRSDRRPHPIDEIHAPTFALQARLRREIDFEILYHLRRTLLVPIWQEGRKVEIGGITPEMRKVVSTGAARIDAFLEQKGLPNTPQNRQRAAFESRPPLEKKPQQQQAKPKQQEAKPKQQQQAKPNVTQNIFNATVGGVKLASQAASLTVRAMFQAVGIIVPTITKVALKPLELATSGTAAVAREIYLRTDAARTLVARVAHTLNERGKPPSGLGLEKAALRIAEARGWGEEQRREVHRAAAAFVAKPEKFGFVERQNQAGKTVYLSKEVDKAERQFIDYQAKAAQAEKHARLTRPFNDVLRVGNYSTDEVRVGERLTGRERYVEVRERMHEKAVQAAGEAYRRAGYKVIVLSEDATFREGLKGLLPKGARAMDWHTFEASTRQKTLREVWSELQNHRWRSPYQMAALADQLKKPDLKLTAKTVILADPRGATPVELATLARAPKAKVVMCGEVEQQRFSRALLSTRQTQTQQAQTQRQSRSQSQSH